TDQRGRTRLGTRSLHLQRDHPRPPWRDLGAVQHSDGHDFHGSVAALSYTATGVRPLSAVFGGAHAASGKNGLALCMELHKYASPCSEFPSPYSAPPATRVSRRPAS